MSLIDSPATDAPPVHATLAVIVLMMLAEDPDTAVTLDMMRRWQRQHGDMPAPTSRPGVEPWQTPSEGIRCPICRWPLVTSGHEDGIECPDLIMYRYWYVKQGKTLAQIAGHCGRPTSYIRTRLLDAGVELRARGRKGVEEDQDGDLI